MSCVPGIMSVLQHNVPLKMFNDENVKCVLFRFLSFRLSQIWWA